MRRKSDPHRRYIVCFDENLENLYKLLELLTNDCPVKHALVSHENIYWAVVYGDDELEEFLDYVYRSLLHLGSCYKTQRMEHLSTVLIS